MKPSILQNSIISVAVATTILCARDPYAFPSATQNGNIFETKVTQYSFNYQENLSYNWNVQNVTTGNTKTYSGENPNISINERGYYKILFTATNSAGEQFKWTISKFITSVETLAAPLPIAKLDLLVGDDSASITATSENAAFNWIYIKKDGAFVSYEKVNSKDLVNLEPGTYWVQVTAVNSDAKLNQIEKTFEIVEKTIPEETITVDNDHIADYTIGTPTEGITKDVTIGSYSNNLITKLGARTAYEQGWTGEDVKVAVIDTGLKSSFNGTFENGIDMSGSGTVYDYVGHGSMVSSIIAGSRFDNIQSGIAFDATIVPVKAFSGETGSFKNIVDSIKYVNSRNDVSVANISLGGSYISQYEIDTYKNDIIDAVKNDNSFIWAAGNDGLSCLPVNGSINGQCNMSAALPSLVGFEELSTSDGAWIIVGSVDDNKVISDFSNLAGVTKDYFMVAYGENVVVKDDSSYYYASGTSFAAPQVTAAFALLSQKFPYLTGRDKQDILLSTSEDLGAAGVDEIYGHGLLDIDKAMQPIGELQITNSRNLDVSNIAKYNVTQSTISGTIASSTLLKTLSTKVSSIATFDDYNREYNADISNNVDLNTYIGFDFSNYVYIPSTSNFFIGLNQGDQSAVIGYKLSDNFNIKYGQDDTYLGLSGDGAFGIDGQTNYIGVASNFNIKGVDFGTSLSYGKTSGDAVKDGFFTNVQDANLVGYELTAKFGGLSLGVKREMMPISGSIDVVIPETRTMSGDVVSNTETVNLRTGLGENVKLAAKYDHTITETLSLETSYLGNSESNLVKTNLVYTF